MPICNFLYTVTSHEKYLFYTVFPFLIAAAAWALLPTLHIEQEIISF